VNNIWAVAVKEFLHVLRDKRTLMLIVFMPFMQLMLYGFAVNMDVKHLATVVNDQDKTYLTRRLVDTFVQSAYFDVVKNVDSQEDLRYALDHGKAKVGIVIPPTFTRDALSGKGAQLQVLVDGTDSNPANVAVASSQSIVTAFMYQEGLLPAQNAPIDVRPRLWYNPDLKSTYFMIPGLVGLILQFIVPMITASAIVREKERGNIEQLLVTPIKSYELMIGKLIPYVCIGLVIVTLILSVSWLFFHVPIRGNLFTLFVLTLLYISLCLAIGLFASTVADNQQQSSQIVMMFAAPSILLSGFVFPRETMPWPIFYLSQLIPMTYFLQIARGIILKGLGFMDLLNQIIPLLAMTVIVMTLSVLRFTKRIK
jgi:ABC-2 type transport system permease protein